MPVSILIVVDLPAPLGPMKASSSPGSRLKVTPLTAWACRNSGRATDLRLPRSPASLRLTENVLARLRTSMIGMRGLYTFLYNFDDLSLIAEGSIIEKMASKFWLNPVVLQRAGGFSRTELNRIATLVIENQALLLERWYEFFGH